MGARAGVCTGECNTIVGAQSATSGPSDRLNNSDGPLERAHVRHAMMHSVAIFITAPRRFLLTWYPLVSGGERESSVEVRKRPQ